jgi:uncharacterized protein (DUF885 family)
MMRRRDFLAHASAATAAVIAGRPSSAATAPKSEDERLNALLSRLVEQILRESPEIATSLGLDVAERGVLRAQLEDRSARAIAQRHEQCLARLREIDTIDRARLSQSTRTTYDATRIAHQLAVEGGRFEYGAHSLRDVVSQTATPYVVSQMTGSFFEVPQFLEGEHPVDDATDADGYLARLEQFAAVLDGETQRVRADRGRGVVPPAFVLDVVLTQMSAVLRGGVADSTMVRSLARRTVAKSIRGEPAERAVQIVERRVFPALSRQLAELQISRKAAADVAGMSSLPEGERYYAWLLEVATTSGLSADEIHRLGKEQSAEIEAQMDRMLRELGMTTGSVGERMNALGTDPSFLFPDDDAGRAQAIAYVRALVDQARSRLSELSALGLRADLRVERVPPEIELGAAGAFVVPGSIDGSRPSVYYLNLRTTSAWPKWALPTLTHHEALPGHVWQEALGNERRPWHLIRSIVKFNAYSEGWGLYAEQLADEIGLYRNDVAGRLGYLQAQQLRASRLVVDTGVHAKRWSRDQAIEWMVRATGRPRQVMAGEVDRYCVKPGQACGYKMGQTQILRVRERARSMLGAAFELKTFNDWVLGAGNVPMSVLADVIEQRITHGRDS